MKVPRSLVLSCFLAIAFCQTVIASNHRRQQPPGSNTSTQNSTPANTTPTTTQQPTTTPTTAQTTTTPTTANTTPTTTAATTPPSTSQNPATTPTTTSQQTTPPATTADTATSVNTDTGAVTVTQTNTASTSSSDQPPQPTTSSPPSNNGSGLGIGPIIGMSVAGGIALIAIVAFFIWKFSRKRFSDFDDNEAIKWPELNAHGGGDNDSHPLPVHNTGRAGFDTGSEASLSRAPSTSNYSTPDVGSVNHDPYAVPPLPHLNPNQPYRDDPGGQAGYYDPYRGPVPNTLEHGVDWSGEAIPMTQMAGANGGRMSPAQVPYGSGRASPGPQMAYGGRSSPGPQAAYGAGRVSPGPQTAYGAGRMSPGPQTAYGR